MIQIKPSSSALRLKSSTKDWAVWRAVHQLTCSGEFVIQTAAVKMPLFENSFWAQDEI